jgi:type VI secretion system secreted protein VgrG
MVSQASAAVSYRQATRLLALETTLGEDVLLARKFDGDEALSRLFLYRLEALGTRDDIKPAEIVGKKVTLTLRLDDGTRPFNGFVRRFRGGALFSRDLRLYSLEIVPWLWFLTLNSTCRFFQDKTAPQVIEAVFKERGFHDFEMSDLHAVHPVREYCVQYRESDFDFVSRLMEEEGIFYFFRHQNGKHTLVLADQTGAYRDCAEREIAFTGGSLSDAHIERWEHGFAFHSGKWAQADYNFETPSTNLLTTTHTIVDLPGVDRYEVYDYPGIYDKSSDGQGRTKLRMEETEAGHEVVDAGGHCRTLFPGGKFLLSRHDCASEENKGYVVTRITHEARDDSYVHGSDGGYSNAFTCIPRNVVFRPPRETEKPAIHSVQTAVVVGPDGDEIHTDKYGRIKARFHWDRDAKQSCWIRVAQSWAGRNWGAWFVPRIGQEVVVAFVEGDPDRPLVIGSVHNAEYMPPYGPPGSQTQSGIRTRSSKGGSAANCNEIMFEDAKGAEVLSVHAEKDHAISVENDEGHSVGRDRSKTIGRHETTQVGGNRTETVTLNETIAIGGNRAESVTGNETIGITGSRTETVTGPEVATIMGSRTHTVLVNEALTVAGPRELTVAGPETIGVGGGRSVSVVGDQTSSFTGSHTIGVGGDQAVRVGGGQTFSVTGDQGFTVGGNGSQTVSGNLSVNVTGDAAVVSGKTLTIEATDEITIKTGSASIVMKKNGDISIDGNNIAHTGSGKISHKADGDVIIKGQKISQN